MGSSYFPSDPQSMHSAIVTTHLLVIHPLSNLLLNHPRFLASSSSLHQLLFSCASFFPGCTALILLPFKFLQLGHILPLATLSGIYTIFIPFLPHFTHLTSFVILSASVLPTTFCCAFPLPRHATFFGYAQRQCPTSLYPQHFLSCYMFPLIGHAACSTPHLIT